MMSTVHTYVLQATGFQTWLYSVFKATVTELKFCDDPEILMFHGTVLDGFSQETFIPMCFGHTNMMSITFFQCVYHSFIAITTLRVYLGKQKKEDDDH